VPEARVTDLGLLGRKWEWIGNSDGVALGTRPQFEIIPVGAT